ncbi:MAG: S49 family peptidase [Gammaproteobacteria bacterium]|jgi:protease-4|nr:S49 family peptidase [Gammaproteobacteria bacterium]
MTDSDRKDPWLGPPRPGDAPSKEASSAVRASDEPWARDTLEKLVFASLREQRAARRWGIFFKLAFLAYLLLIFFMMAGGAGVGSVAKGKHTALVEISGVIASDQAANADAIITGLRSAFENSDAEAVILRINSPGGSPVQAGYVNDELRRLRGLHQDKKVYAVITDVCASGGYYIAVAADEIYADKASIVGSIGVLMDGFGFVDTLEKLGVERRLMTAGESKGFLDPFSPMKADDAQHLRGMLGQIHQQFITVVREGRGDRLKDDSTLFTGLTWTGEESVRLGLTDGLASSSMVARDIVGAERIVDYTHRPPVFERFAGRLGGVLADGVLTAFRGELR